MAASSPPAQHHPIQLQYQRGLPMSRGKVMLWLFLSTEIMFFAGLIGSYVVLRFGAPSGTWPRPGDVHVEEWVGAVNTFVLICSSLSIVLAHEAARHDRVSSARRWLLATLLLGATFLGFKAYEYHSKWSHNLIPKAPHGSMYDRADTTYVSAVTERLAQLTADMYAETARQNDLQVLLDGLPDQLKGLQREIDDLTQEQSELRQQLEPAASTGSNAESEADVGPIEALDEEERTELQMELDEVTEDLAAASEEYNRLRRQSPDMRDEFKRLSDAQTTRESRLKIAEGLLNSAAKWTSNVVGTDPDAVTQQMAMMTLAYDIYPLEAYASVAEHYRKMEAVQLEQAVRDLGRLTAQSTKTEESATAQMNKFRENVAFLVESQQQLTEALAELAESAPENSANDSNAETAVEQGPADDGASAVEAALEQPVAPEVEEAATADREPTLAEQLVIVRQQLSIANEQYAAAATEVTGAQQTLQDASTELARINSRR
ncbi:MAG: cytochrome c oxidase subunit 3, partial [Planctomycetales bacterium]|nr:cytochrome c oxidase subunit 3 [Planctomycetales bacterium]